MDHLHTINHPSRLHDVRFCKRVVGEGEVLLVAAEDKKLSVYDMSNGSEGTPTMIAVMIGHSNRSGYFHPVMILGCSFSLRQGESGTNTRYRSALLARRPTVYDNSVHCIL